MELITKAQTEQLLADGRAQRAAIDQDTGALDFEPVVKLFSILPLAGPFAHPCTRPAPATQRRDSGAPHGLRPLPRPCGNATLFCADRQNPTA